MSDSASLMVPVGPGIVGPAKLGGSKRQSRYMSNLPCADQPVEIDLSGRAPADAEENRRSLPPVDAGSTSLGEPAAAVEASAPATRREKRQETRSKLKLKKVAQVYASWTPTSARSRDVHEALQPSATGFLPMISLNSFVVNQHPLFHGTSCSFREEISPLFKKRFLGGPNATLKAIGDTSLDRSEISRNSLTDSQELQVIDLFVQDKGAPEELDGLVITDGRFDVVIEVVFEGSSVGTMRQYAMFGQEMVLGCAKYAFFGIRCLQMPCQSVWLLPREALEPILQMACYAEDVALLTARARKSVVDRLLRWMHRNIPRVRIRLFANASRSFMERLVGMMGLIVAAADSIIAKEGDQMQSCLCILHGEAVAYLDGKEIAQVTQKTGSSDWAAWWGLLEALGTCQKRPSMLRAITDCTVLELSGRDLVVLRREFPAEYGFFEQVALKNIKCLSSFRLDVFQVPFLMECNPAFLQVLSLKSTQRICLPGEMVIHEWETGDEMFVLVRGRCDVSRSELRVGKLGEGSCFGELAVLGISRTRTATVTCETICDLRVLDRSSLLEALNDFPDEGKVVERIAEAHGYSRRLALEELKQVDALRDHTDAFIKRLADHMYEQAFFVGQSIMSQNTEGYHMYVVVHGTVAIQVDGMVLSRADGPVVLGEMALLSPGSRYLTTVRCESICDCLLIQTSELSGILRDDFPEDMQKLQNQADTHIEIFRHSLMERFQARKEVSINSPDEKTVTKRSFGWDSGYFAGSSSAFLERLSLELEKRVFLDGQVLLREGEEGSIALLLHNGSGIVEVGGTRVGEVKSGDFVGEVVLLGFSAAYTATIKAVGLVSAFAIQRDKMREVIEEFPDERDRLEHVMKRRQNISRKLAGAVNLITMSRKPKDGDEQDVAPLTGRQSFKMRQRWTQGSLGLSEMCSLVSPRGSVRPAQASTMAHRDVAGNDELISPRQLALDERLRELHVHEVDDRRKSSESLTSVIRPPNQKSRAQVDSWVRRREEAMRMAPGRRDARLLRTGAITERLPPNRSYRDCNTIFTSAVSEGEGGGESVCCLPSATHLRRAEDLYGRPVWHEVFAGPLL